MCGIIAVVRRPSDRPIPSAAEIEALLEASAQALVAVLDRPLVTDVDVVSVAAERAGAADRLLRGLPGLRAMLASSVLRASIENHSLGLEAQVRQFERRLDLEGAAVAGETLEALNAGLISLKDAVWGLRRDRLRAAHEVETLAGVGAGPAAVAVHFSVHQALSALDRLEVRGRDSAGVHLLVRDHGLDLDAPAVRAVLAERARDPLFGSLAVRTPEGHLSFVYKTAAEIGELGDNTRDLRAAIGGDPLLRQALGNDAAEAVVLGHTRWASVGIVSQPNAHPLNSDELDNDAGAYVTAALNGDVDNFADLKAMDGLLIAPEITTDAKVIPTLTSRSLADGDQLERGVPPDREPPRRLRRHRRRFRGGALRSPAGAAGERSGALHRAGRGRLRRGQ